MRDPSGALAQALLQPIVIRPGSACSIGEVLRAKKRASQLDQLG
jgi:hypothetical protein